MVRDWAVKTLIRKIELPQTVEQSSAAHAQWRSWKAGEVGGDSIHRYMAQRDCRSIACNLPLIGEIMKTILHFYWTLSFEFGADSLGID